LLDVANLAQSPTESTDYQPTKVKKERAISWLPLASHQSCLEAARNDADSQRAVAVGRDPIGHRRRRASRARAHGGTPQAPSPSAIAPSLGPVALRERPSATCAGMGAAAPSPSVPAPAGGGEPGAPAARDGQGSAPACCLRP